MKPGIYRDVVAADYFADPCPEPSLSQSIAKLLIERSALHGKLAHPRLSPPRPEDEPDAEKYVKAHAIGNAAHKLMLGRGKDIDVIDFADFRKNEAKQLRDLSYGAGRTPVLAEQADDAEAMVNSARAQLATHEASDAFTNGSGEVMIVWQEGGLWFRQLIDWLAHDLRTVDDFKTTGLSVAPHMIPRLMASADWPIQAAMAERGLDVLDPDNAGRRRFRFIAQENTEPFALTVAQIGEGALTMGRKRLQAGVDIWQRCLRANRWPGYINRVVIPDYPAWAESQWLEREITEFSGENILMAG